MEQQESLDNGCAKNSNSEKKKNSSMNDEDKLKNQEERESTADQDTETKLRAELEEAKKEAEDFKDKYLRSVAEMDNLRKRIARERSDLLKFGNEDVLRDILPVLDSFEQACQEAGGNGAEDGSRYLQGMNLVKKQLLDVLERNGLKVIDAVGKAFDPNLHQALQRVDSEDVEEDQVQMEYAKGYTLHDRLLRPAMVSVAVPTHKGKGK